MYVADLLQADAIELGCGADSKETVIDALIDLLDKTGCLSDKAVFKQAVLAREQLASTGISEGIAMPHARSGAVKKVGISVVSLNAPVDFQARDGKPTRFLFMIATPEGSDNLHLEIVGRLSLLLLEKDFREKIMHLGDKEKFIKLFDRVEAKTFLNLE